MYGNMHTISSKLQATRISSQDPSACWQSAVNVIVEGSLQWLSYAKLLYKASAQECQHVIKYAMTDNEKACACMHCWRAIVGIVSSFVGGNLTQILPLRVFCACAAGMAPSVLPT